MQNQTIDTLRLQQLDFFLYAFSLAIKELQKKSNEHTAVVHYSSVNYHEDHLDDPIDFVETSFALAADGKLRFGRFFCEFESTEDGLIYKEVEVCLKRNDIFMYLDNDLMQLSLNSNIYKLKKDLDKFYQQIKKETSMSSKK